MEKWHALLLIGIILLGWAVYNEYFSEKITLRISDSPLNSIQHAQSVTLNAANFSSVSGVAALEIIPSNGYIVNGTLVITCEDSGATIKVYSSLPLKVKGGTGNATVILPMVNSKLHLDIIYTFTNSSNMWKVTYELYRYNAAPLNATVYAKPG